MSETSQPRASGTGTDVDEYLRKPYSRILIPQDGGSFSAEILEFPGCFAQGDSAESAYQALEAAAASWLHACIEAEIPIPPPLTNYEVSGKFALRLPRSLYTKATMAAAKEGTSLNQWVTVAVSEKIGQTAAADRIEVLFAKLREELELSRTNRLAMFEPIEGRLRAIQMLAAPLDRLPLIIKFAENRVLPIVFPIDSTGQSSRDHA